MKMLGKSSLADVLGKIITVLWVLGIISLFTGPVYLVASFISPGIVSVSDMPHPYLLEIKNSNDTPTMTIDRHPEWMKEPNVRLMATIDFKGGTYRAAFFKLAGYMLAIISLITVFYLRKVFKSLSAGTPFIKKNARYLRIIAWVSIGSVAVSILYNWLTHVAIKNSISIEGAVLHTNWISVLADVIGDSVPRLFYGFVVLVLAELFRIGAEMKEEQDLTI